jgi:hypothetical protein
MKNWDCKKILGLIKNEKRIFLTLVFLVLAFLVNQALYANHRKTAESCAGGKCLNILPEKPQLTKDTAYYYVDDLFKDQPSGYYRLTFQEKSNQAEKILLKLNTYTEKENQISELAVASSDKFQKQELFFFLPEGFDSLLFQKENFSSAGNIFIKEASITQLGITSQAEFLSMKKTVVGETDISEVKISQLASNYSFPWLREPKTILGQVFQAKESVISAVALKIDINKNLNPGSRQYALSLREVNYDGEKVSLNGPVIVDSAFSVSSIEKYRQADGTFLFPLFGTLEKGKYYLISLDNVKISITNQNYLELKGSQADDSYPNGSAVMKKLKSWYPIDGDLYFKIYGADLLAEDGVQILNGAKIEDLGKGIGKYSYAPKGKFIDLLDLETASLGTKFSENDKVIYAPAKDGASYSYVANALYPINKINFSASQLRATWKNVRVSYSFDQNDWIDLVSSEKSEVVASSNDNLATDQSGAADNSSTDNTTTDNSNTDNSDSATTNDNSTDTSSDQAGVVTQETVQVFDADIVPAKEVRTVYFRITYDPNDTSSGRYFALKNLKITADLKMK